MGFVNDLLIKLGWDGTAAKRGMQEAEAEAGKAASKMEKTLNKFTAKQEKYLTKHLLGAFGISALVSGFESMADEAAKINKESAKLGLTVESFQEIAYASKETGRSVEDIVANLQRMPPDVKAAVEAFRAMGTGMDKETVSALARAHENIEQLKTYGTIFGGQLAGGYTKLGELMGRGITRTESYWQHALGNHDYADELMATTLQDPDDETETKRLQTRLTAALTKREARRTAAKEKFEKEFWEGWDETGEAKAKFEQEFWEGWDEVGDQMARRKEAIDKARQGTPFRAETMPGSLANIGGFYGGADPAVLNLLNQQLEVMQRMAEVVTGDAPRLTG